MRSWIAFFSQTGSEIANIATKLEKWPDLIITNKRPAYLRTIDARIVTYKELSNNPKSKDYLNILENYDNPFITLHGWLRVVPEDICNKFEMYNGHPGLVNFYPDLKGKDPQYRAFEKKYPYVGSIIHRLTSEVDGGEIVLDGIIKNNNLDLLDLVAKLKDVSLVLWLKFLSRRFNEEGSCASWIFKYREEYDIRTIENKIE